MATLDLRSLISRIRAWRYVASEKRDLRLDALRGVAAIAMIIDHVGGSESWLYRLTGANQFFTSGAEAFVLIAGLTMGIVYNRLIASSGVWAAARKALRRAGVLYILTVCLTIGFAATSILGGVPWRPTFGPNEAAAWVLSVATLQRTFYLADILLMYVLLMCAAAPALIALAFGRTRWLIAASVGLWLAWQIAPQYATIPWPITNNVMFHFSSWQLIFIGGLVIGYHAKAVEAAVQRFWPMPIVTAIAVGALALAALYGFAMPRGLLDEDRILGQLFMDKGDVPVGRILALAIFFVLGYGVLTLVWEPVNRVGGRLLMPLGQHALSAYSLHLFALVAWAYVFPTWTVERSATANAAIQIAALCSVWIAVVVWVRIEDRVALPWAAPPPVPPVAPVGTDASLAETSRAAPRAA